MYFFSHKIVLKMYKAKIASKKDYPKLHEMISDISHAARIPKPQVYIIPSQNPNAFATGRNPQNGVVACTQGIMELLTPTELKGVLAHEISHIKNRDILITTIAATLAGVISYVASMARFAAIFGGMGRDNDGGGLLELLVLAIVTPFIALILQLAISRSREYLADKTGAELIRDPHSLANALEKLHLGNKKVPMRQGSATTSSMFIVNPFSKKGFASLFSTHPHVEERVKRLRAMDF
jgi:heat shock protein HtpX